MNLTREVGLIDWSILFTPFEEFNVKVLLWKVWHWSDEWVSYWDNQFIVRKLNGEKGSNLESLAISVIPLGPGNVFSLLLFSLRCLLAYCITKVTTAESRRNGVINILDVWMLIFCFWDRESRSIKCTYCGRASQPGDCKARPRPDHHQKSPLLISQKIRPDIYTHPLII